MFLMGSCRFCQAFRILMAYSSVTFHQRIRQVYGRRFWMYNTTYCQKRTHAKNKTATRNLVFDKLVAILFTLRNLRRTELPMKHIATSTGFEKKSHYCEKKRNWKDFENFLEKVNFFCFRHFYRNLIFRYAPNDIITYAVRLSKEQFRNFQKENLRMNAKSFNVIMQFSYNFRAISMFIMV